MLNVREWEDEDKMQKTHRDDILTLPGYSRGLVLRKEGTREYHQIQL
jgi:hypothetical protein